MTTYLHNTCSKMPAKGNFTVAAVKRGKKDQIKTLFFETAVQKIKILCCPFCGQTAKEIIKNY